MEFAFCDHVLDVDRRELRRRGELIALEPQVFDLLVYLVRNRDRVVSKDDLLQAIWGGRIVSESTMTSRINAARQAVGDSGEAQRLIRPCRGRASALSAWCGRSMSPRHPSLPDRSPRMCRDLRSLSSTSLRLRSCPLPI